MRQFLKGAATYKLAILIGCLFSINALAAAIILSFMNTDWSSLSPTSKFIVIVGVVQNWTGTMLAFFNKTLARVESGKSPIETGDSTPPFPGYGPQKPLTPPDAGATKPV